MPSALVNKVRQSRLALKLVRSIRWLGLHELPVLLSMVALFGGTWLFVNVADEVVERETGDIDKRIMLSLRSDVDPGDPIGPGWVEEMGRDFTALGSTAVLTLLTLVALGYLLLRRQNRMALFTLLAIAGGIVLSTLLKMGFDRPRPDIVPHETIVYTASFPSGHAMLSAVTYLTLAALLSGVHRDHIMKAYLMLIAILVTLVVGASRVYLGVHWPTDVLAGWTAGAAWASFIWLLERALQRRGVVEGEDSARHW